MRAPEQFRIYTNSPIKYLVDFFIKNSLKDLHYEEIRKFIKEIKTGKTPQKKFSSYWDKKEYNWFRPEDVGKNIYLENSSEKISFSAVEQNKATIYQKNTLLITGIGDLGRIGILKKEASSNQQITGILFNDKVVPEFGYFYFLSMKNQFDEESSKTTLPILNQKRLSSIKIKIPRIELQKEFVKFMNYCWSCLENNKLPENSKFNLDSSLLQFAKKVFLIYYSKNGLIENSQKDETLLKKLRQAILSEAVQGKLFPQKPEDEPASELLKKIKKEKEKLIKEGKIKKQKPLPEISEDEVPYELPGDWVWCRLGEVCEYIQRGKSPKYSEIEKIPVISQKCVQWEGFNINKVRFIEEESLDKYEKVRFLQDKDLLWNSTGDGTIGRICMYEEKINPFGIAVADSHVTILRGIKKFVLPKFILMWISSNFVQDNLNVSGSTKQTELGTGTVQKQIIPLPPLSEQKRIVEKVDSLMKFCDDLENRIKENKESSEQLMNSVLREVFED